MFKRTALAAIAIGALGLGFLQGCEPLSQSTSTSPASEANTGKLSFRLSKEFTASVPTKGLILSVTITGQNLLNAIHFDQPADTNEILIRDLPPGLVRVEILLTDSLALNSWFGDDTTTIESFKVNQMRMVLARNTTTDLLGRPVGFLEVIMTPDLSVPGQSQDASWKCQNPGPGGYCLDPELRVPEFVGPWNCQSWKLVDGKRSCTVPLPVIVAPLTDSVCQKYFDGSPKVCLEARDWKAYPKGP